ncbi:hypothetical protein FRB99_001927, partial [Tulasnella sp. 403]
MYVSHLPPSLSLPLHSHPAKLRNARARRRAHLLIVVIVATVSVIHFVVILTRIASSYRASAEHESLRSSPTRHTLPTTTYISSSDVEDELCETISSHSGGRLSSDLSDLRAMVASTNGYVGRDWSLSLGWNSVSVEIIQVHIISDEQFTLSSCEHHIQACTAFAPLIQHGISVDSEKCRDRPSTSGIAWRIPLETMLDIPYLRKTHKVILVREYLQLQDLDPGLETTNGSFDRINYVPKTANLTVHVITNSECDPSSLVLVDSSHPLQADVAETVDNDHAERLSSLMGDGRPAVEWEDVRSAVLNNSANDEGLEKFLARNGWATLYTYASGLVVEPVRQAAPRDRIVGWVEKYGSEDADIVALEAETHVGGEPGNMRFATANARDEFSQTVLYSIKPSDQILELADKVARRMQERVDGRMWMAAYMRRDDCWMMGSSIGHHLAKIQSKLDEGHETLRRIVDSGELMPFDVPGVEVDQSQLSFDVPRRGDPFFLATDERSTENLEYLRRHGAILIQDLLTVDDRRQFGWPIIMLTD